MLKLSTDIYLIQGPFMNNMQRNRFQSFKFLMDKSGGRTSFMQTTDLHTTYISHILHGKRNLGPKLCRYIEKKFKLKPNWMDKKH